MAFGHIAKGAFGAFLIVAAAPSTPLEGQPWRDGDERGGPACVAYEHVDFAGETLPLGRRTDTAFVGPRWNDRISSVECRPGCELIAYEHANFAGAQQRYSGRAGAFGPFWNDRISAVRVSCEPPRFGGGLGRGPACVAFEHANFAGQRYPVRDGEAVPSIGPAWNDRISAISCRPGCELIAFEHIEYRGQTRRFTGEESFVGPQWNDRISALRVECG